MFGTFILLLARVYRRKGFFLRRSSGSPLLRDTFVYLFHIIIDAMIHECPRVESRHRSRFQHCIPSAEPSPAARSVGGLLSEIQSSIKQQPFTEDYSIIPGKELGR